jgi:hypothetical protein
MACKAQDVPHVPCLPSLHSDQLEIGTNSIVPHLNGWIKVVVWLQDFSAFFLAWILISVICLYSLIIIERNHGGDGYPQY